MKRILLILVLAFAGMLPQKATAQAAEIEQLLLNVEKLAQFKQILRDMRKGYEVLEGGYNTIRDISQGNFDLHKAFLDGLLQVSPAVRNYRRVADVVGYQVQLVNEYKAAAEHFRTNGNFTEGELKYLDAVYGRLLKESLRNLDELATVMTAGKLRMSDEERLQTIDRIYLDMQDKLTFLRSFNDETRVLSVQRSRERNDVKTMRRVYGINN